MSKENKTKLLKEQVKELYFEQQKHHSEVSILLGISSDMVMYYAKLLGFNQISYLINKYSTEFLVKSLETLTYKELAKKLNIKLSRLSTLFKYKGIKRDTSVFYLKNKVNSSFFSDKNSEKELYYFLGLVTSDGYIKKNTVRIIIKNKGAKKLLTNLSNYIGHNNVIEYKGDYIEVSFTNKNLIKKIEEIGIPLKNKTYNLKDVYIPNKETLLCFLCGLLDGDGTVKGSKSKYGYKTSLTFSIVNYNEEFLSNLQIKIKDFLGIESKLYTKKDVISELYVGKKNNSELLFKQMYDVSPFYLECKYKKYTDILNKVMI